MDDFSHYFWNESKKFVVHKWHHYFEIYDRHFAKYRGTNPVILEIGVAEGGSLEMWNYYFQGECTIYGIDINPNCKRFESAFSNVKIFIGSQDDDNFLNKIKSEIPKIDILIDDGSHVNSHVIKSFEYLYPNITSGGTYLIEDLHTSYWPEYGGGLQRSGTSIEYLKTLIDKLNAKHQKIAKKQFAWSPEVAYKADESFSNITNSLHFYDSITVVEKHKTPQLTVQHSMRG
jgi:hypothetical protein